MSDLDQQEADSEKRAQITVDAPFLYLEVCGAEGESLEDIEDVFEDTFEDVVTRVEEAAEKLEDKTFQ